MNKETKNGVTTSPSQEEQNSHASAAINDVEINSSTTNPKIKAIKNAKSEIPKSQHNK